MLYIQGLFEVLGVLLWSTWKFYRHVNIFLINTQMTVGVSQQNTGISIQMDQ